MGEIIVICECKKNFNLLIYLQLIIYAKGILAKNPTNSWGGIRQK